MDLFELANEYADSKETLETVAKEILHYEILQSLYQNNNLIQNLVFQGGTALRLCYDNDRYSEDLDFIFTNESGFNKKILDDFKDSFISKIKDKYDLEAKIIEPKEGSSDKFKRWKAKIFLNFLNKQSKINIEIMHLQSYENVIMKVKTNYPEIGTSMSLRVESLKEILADKLVALVLRNYIKYRDFWDIKFLKDKLVPSDYDLVKKKFIDYGCDNIQKVLDEKQQLILNTNLQKGFDEEMIRFLSKNEFQWVKDNDFFKYIKQVVFEEFVQLSKHFCNKIYSFNKTENKSEPIEHTSISQDFNPNDSSALNEIKAEEQALQKQESLKLNEKQDNETKTRRMK